MDFFEAQERARRRTGWLVVLFSIAVCGTVMAVYAVAMVALHLLGLRPLIHLPRHLFAVTWAQDRKRVWSQSLHC